MAEIGRPSKLTPELIAKASGYLATCGDSYDPTTETWDVELPSIEGLALYLDISRETVHAWSREAGEDELKQAFSDIVKRILANQAKVLFNRSLGGAYNPTIAKLLLTKHGYADKQETDVTTAGEKLNTEMTPAMLAAQLKAAKVYEEEVKKSLLE